MYTNYTLVEEHYQSQKGKAWGSKWGLTRKHAMDVCRNLGGSLAQIDKEEAEHLVTYLVIWKHESSLGNVWLKSIDNDTCQIIEVTKESDLSEVQLYSHRTLPYDDVDNARNVLCEVLPTGFYEECGDHEFECDNGMCISTDSRCDHQYDCTDMSDEKNCECGDHMFSCANGHCIPMSLYCDYEDQCGDNSDETSCIDRLCGAEQFTCSSGQCIDLHSVCDFVVDCKDHSDKEKALCDHHCNGIQCFSGACINSHLAKDLVPDCPGFALEDEREAAVYQSTYLEMYVTQNDSDVNEITNKTFEPRCSQNGPYAQCRAGHSHCYRREMLCIHDTVVVDENQMTYIQDSCRESTHLRTQCDKIEHPGLYQCSTGYFIALRKLCDGVRDCTEGEDEAACEDYSCPGQFKCKGESYCISHSDVCDGTVHCMLHREDEKYCNLPDDLCDNGCVCEGLTMTCQHRDRSANTTDLTQGRNRIAIATRSLNLRHASVKLDSTSFRHLHFLGKLLLSHNDLHTLPVDVFTDLHNLFELDLSFNHLAAISRGVFKCLASLRLLDLSNNGLTQLTRDSLYGLSELKHLILLNNQLETMAEDALDDLGSLSEINTDKYKFCYVATEVEVCTPEGDEFSSCEDLMANSTLQICTWLLGVVAFMGNVFVIVWRLKKDRSKVSSFFIINLGFSDFLMGVYLLIIASVDVYYRGDYIMYAENWKHHYLHH